MQSLRSPRVPRQTRLPAAHISPPPPPPPVLASFSAPSHFPSLLPSWDHFALKCLSVCFWGTQPTTLMHAASASWDWIPRGERTFSIPQKQSLCSDLTPSCRAPHVPWSTVCVLERGLLWLPCPPSLHQLTLQATRSLPSHPLGYESREGRDWDLAPVWLTEDAQG